MIKIPALLALTILVALAACTQVPELEDHLTPQLRRADYPTLIPLDETLGPRPDPAAEATEIEEELAARVAALQNRARALQTPVVDADAREKLQQDITQ